MDSVLGRGPVNVVQHQRRKGKSLPFELRPQSLAEGVFHAFLSRILSSTFEVDGTSVHVTTIAHPTRDEVAVRVKTRRINSSSPHRVAHTNAPQNAVTWGAAMTDSTGNESSSGVDPVLAW